MVNIKDIYEIEKEEKLVYSDILNQIFDKQKELLEKYRNIEEIPVIDINNPKHQKILKEFTFRGIEELAEAYEAYLNNDTEHLIEEISDSIHFFTELLLLVDINQDLLENIDNYKSKNINLNNIKDNLWEITYYFSISANILKCKPWKTTQILTDINKYKQSLIIAYNKFMIILIFGLGFTNKEILEIYIKKNIVNKFRIRSKY